MRGGRTALSGLVSSAHHVLARAHAGACWPPRRRGRVAKILGVENYAPSMGALRSDRAISGPSNRFTDLVEVGEQASRRAVRRRFFQALNVCDTPGSLVEPRSQPCSVVIWPSSDIDC